MKFARGLVYGPAAWVLTIVIALGVVAADVWDRADDGSFTANELVHGTDQFHDLASFGSASTDQDWYRVGMKPRASYEVILDSTGASIAGVASGAGPSLTRQYLPIGGPLQTAAAVTSKLGFSRSLRWENTAISAETTNYVTVQSGGCTTTCDTQAVYQIRMYETTYGISRFNNSASQITVLLIQNTAKDTVAGRVNFFNTAGTFLGDLPFTLNPAALLTVNTSTLGFASGQGGSMTVSNSGSYGDLVGKAVAVEPATGFTFDTSMTPRPR